MKTYNSKRPNSQNTFGKNQKRNSETQKRLCYERLKFRFGSPCRIADDLSLFQVFLAHTYSLENLVPIINSRICFFLKNKPLKEMGVKKKWFWVDTHDIILHLLYWMSLNLFCDVKLRNFSCCPEVIYGSTQLLPDAT